MQRPDLLCPYRVVWETTAALAPAATCPAPCSPSSPISHAAATSPFAIPPTSQVQGGKVPVSLRCLRTAQLRAGLRCCTTTSSACIPSWPTYEALPGAQLLAVVVRLHHDSFLPCTLPIAPWLMQAHRPHIHKRLLARVPCDLPAPSSLFK